MSVATKTLYDTDFVEWTARTAELLRARRFDELDLEQLVEEIEDLGKSDRSAVRSQLLRMLLHLLKRRIQPQRDSASWRGSIANARYEIHFKLKDSPSLRRHLEETLQETYDGAVKSALYETGLAATSKQLDIPEICPWTLSALLDGDLDTL
jgi:hypothetical protein